MMAPTLYSKIRSSSASIAAQSSETQSEISSVDSEWSDFRTVALKLGVSNPDDLTMERFKIDRRKLENMIEAESNIDGMNKAEQFFDSIMTDTSTHISWPCRLKIGAKSRKDPHVRIVGMPKNVSEAKERILASLDSRGSRVIMKMDVSYTDHSYIIGRGGNNIKRIMEETSTHIHFPDSNRSNPTEKSNQVSLCGSLEGVEKARSLVRASMPLLISFELPIMAPGCPAPDHDMPFIKEIENKFNVQVIFSSKPKLHSSLVLVKGSEKEAVRVQEATQLLINFTCENIASEILVHMQLEISPQHHEIVKGRSNMNLLNIMERTKTKIIFPDVNDMNIKPIKKSQVTITGTIDGVYKARQQLIGNLPIALLFDYPESYSDSATISKLCHKYGVFISLRMKQRQSTMAIIIKGVEKFIDKVYEARHEILKLSTPIVRPEIPITYFSSTDKELETAFRRTLPSLLSNQDTPFSPNFSLSPMNYTSPVYNNGGGGGGGGCSGGCNGAGNISPYNQISQISPPHQQNSLCIPTKYIQQMQQQQQKQQQNYQLSNLQINGNIHNNTNNSNNNNYLVAPPSTQQIRQSLSPRNSIANTSGYQSFSSSTNSLEQLYPPCNGSNISMPTSNRGHYSPDSAYYSESRSSSINNGTNSARRMSDSGMHNTMTGSSNVGNEYRPNHHYNIKQSRAFDFDMKRIMGIKAIERSPQGEIRVPNSNWIGLGLSASSPAPIEKAVPTATTDDPAWNHGQIGDGIGTIGTGSIAAASTSTFAGISPYNLGATTGLVDSTPINRRVQLSQHRDIHSLLVSLGLEYYIKIFIVNEIDLEMFTTLTEENLIELGITAFGARKKLLLARNSLLAEAALATTPQQQPHQHHGSTSSSSSSASSSSRYSGSAAPGAERRNASRW